MMALIMDITLTPDEKFVRVPAENEKPEPASSGFYAMNRKIVPPIIADDAIKANGNLVCAEPAMSYDVGYIRIPRSLLEDPRFKDAPASWRIILIEIINHAAVFAHDFNDHSEIVRIEVGEICFSIDMIAKLCGGDISHKQVERAIAYFKKVKIAGQRAGHRRSIIKILHEDTYRLIYEQGGTRRGTSAGQARDISKECKERKEEKKKITKKKSADASVCVVVEKLKIREKVELTQKQIDTARAKFGDALFEAMADRLNSYKLSSEKTYASDYGLFVAGSWLIPEAKKLLEAQASPTQSSVPKNKTLADIISRCKFGNYTYQVKFEMFELVSAQGYVVMSKAKIDLSGIEEGLRDKGVLKA